MRENPATPKIRFLLTAYSTIIHVVCAVGLPWLLFRAWKTGKLKEGLGERFGFLNRPWLRRVAAARPVWFHAVSVGEAQMLGPLVERLKEKHPDVPIVVSTTTVPGQEIAKGHRGVDGTFFLPIDLGWAVRKVVRRLNPRLLAILETEIWPNLVVQTYRYGTPVVFLNGRISDRSFPGYLRARWFLEGILRFPTLFGMQSEKNAERIVRMGAPSSRVRVIGNLKYESANELRLKGTPLSRTEFGLDENALVLIGGSTFPGEEEMLIRIYENCLRKHPRLRLIIAPRHPQRFEDAAEVIEKSGHEIARRSGGVLPRPSGEGKPIVLLDVMGELKNLYPLTDVVFIGKSMGCTPAGRGGQNPLEPAVWSRPIVCGPLMENFQEVVDSLNEAGGIDVSPTEREIQDKILELLEDPELRREMGESAYSVIGDSLGVVDRCLAIAEEAAGLGKSESQ